LADIAYNPTQVIQALSDQIATLTRDNAILVSALQVAQSNQQAQVPTPGPHYDDQGMRLPD
jgi:hypothetical protein